jgi:hypothetical protein
MTADRLRAALEQFDATLRILIPGQEWGWSDIGGLTVRTLSFAPIVDRPDMGAWITQRHDAPEAARERCLLISARRSRMRRPPV